MSFKDCQQTVSSTCFAARARPFLWQGQKRTQETEAPLQTWLSAHHHDVHQRGLAPWLRHSLVSVKLLSPLLLISMYQVSFAKNKAGLEPNQSFDRDLPSMQEQDSNQHGSFGRQQGFRGPCVRAMHQAHQHASRSKAQQVYNVLQITASVLRVPCSNL